MANSTLPYDILWATTVLEQHSTSILMSALAFAIIFWYFKKITLLNPSGLPIFISGCDTGIGNHLAIFFDKLGCDVYAGCLNPNESRNSLPESVTVVPLDICSEISVKNAVEQVKASLQDKGTGKLFLYLIFFIFLIYL